MVVVRSSDVLGIARRRRGRGFVYETAVGHPVHDRATLARIRALAIPPAWTDVWIAADPAAHLQATGYDARGRKQYRYHPQWRASRDAVKYHRVVALCRALPRIRAAVARDLARPVLSKRKVVASVVSLVEHAQLRVGNDAYTRANHSYGATTLRTRHAHIHGATLELAFRAKSGKARRVRVTDRRLVSIVRRCRELPGQYLFQYVDEDGAVHHVTSSDVNAYLHEVSGGPFTAKDFRTWAATLGAALLLCELDPPRTSREARRRTHRVLEAVATQLGHSPAICRSSYVHPQLLDDYAAGRLGELASRVCRLARGAACLDVDVLRRIEPAVAAYLSAPGRCATGRSGRRPSRPRSRAR